MSQEKPPQEKAVPEKSTQENPTQENPALSTLPEEGTAPSNSVAGLVADAALAVATEPMKGAGFMGRRGTAPINIGNEPDDQQASSDGAATGAPSPNTLPDTLSPNALPNTLSPTQANPQLHAKMETVEPPKPGMAENAFRLMSYAGLIFLVILLIMQTAAGVYFPTIFLPSEVVLVEAYELMAQAGQWLAPPVTEGLPAALPGYFWFLAGVDALPGLSDPFFLPVATALSALVALLGTYALGLCTGLGNRVSFAAGLMLLSALGFVPMTHWVGPDMLLAGILALSLGCLYRGWANERAFVWLGLGFVLAGMGTLVGGLISLWIPLIASIFLVFWRGTLRRGHRLDAVLGFGLLLVCLAAWLGAVILLTGDSANALAPLFDQLMGPLLPPLWPPQDAWWLGLALLGLGLAPWIFVPLFVSWNKVAANAWSTLKASRKENAGVAWLWICLICGLALLMICSAKPWLMAVPLLPLAMLLLAKALLHLSHTASRMFFLLLALLCLTVGAALSVAGIPVALNALKPHIPVCLADMAANSAGLPLLGGVLLLAALILVRFTNRAYPGGALAVFVLLITMLVQPATLLTGPSHAGKLAVHLPKGMGVGVLPGGILITTPAPTAPATPAPAHEVAPILPGTPATPAPAQVTPEDSEEKLAPQPIPQAPVEAATEAGKEAVTDAAKEAQVAPPIPATPASEPEKTPQSMPNAETHKAE